MGLEQRLQQRVRANKLADDDFEGFSDEGADEDGDEIMNEDEAAEESEAYSEADSDADQQEQGARRPRKAPRDDDEAHASEEYESDAPSDSQNALSSITFGALATAAASLTPSLKRKRPTSSTNLETLRAPSRSPSPFHEADERAAGHKISTHRGPSRSNKHAPTEVSSKRAVSRKRGVVNIPSKPVARDPRFSSLAAGQGALSAEDHRQLEAGKSAYAFLDEYRASEVADLKARVRREKDEARKEGLRKQLKAMEDRERARAKVEEERRVVREHKKVEREAVAQGKKPYFLKKGDVKKQVLRERFEGMSEKKVEKVMERRRKRNAQKERKNMPDSRRAEA